jgi:hypothetical protein
MGHVIVWVTADCQSRESQQIDVRFRYGHRGSGEGIRWRYEKRVSDW